MSRPAQPAIDDDIGRVPPAEDETPDPQIWDEPGHDDVATDRVGLAPGFRT